ncbi:uncharacterized protein [Drosophila takahashii]|uniref:uncharacterized protein n=1 Tax=Drosophila takahashii TaxID=29030 RepID=UPI001CF841B4|nr:mucin-17 [Drosophila takahashii]
MASLTLHLIVIALLASTALSKAATPTPTTTTPTTSTTTTTVTRQRGRGVAFQGEGLRLGGVASVSASTTSTEAPTLRAPRQRRPPTTKSIDITVTVTPIRSRGRSGSAATPLPPVSTTTTAAARLLQRRRSSTSSTTTTTGATPAAGRSSRDRGSVRGPRQPRDTPDSSIRRSWQSAQAPTATPYHAQTPTFSSSGSSSSTSSGGTTSSRGALKTPRMIQRLVAGHIHNAQGHSTYEVSAVSANSSSSSYNPSTSASWSSTSTSSSTSSTSSTTTTTRQPPLKSKASSSYRLAKPSIRPRLSSTVAPSRFSNPPSTSRSTTPLPPTSSNTPNPFKDDDNDDEALLNEPDDFDDNWDNGILRLSAGSGKEAEAPAKKAPGGAKEDQKKTLADQVRDGKYGLIERELFRRVPKRPGVLSYARNSEVPLDNERNYGGLNEEDIWLAEDHLLVIKGGSLNEETDDNQPGGGGLPWPAIDDYDAPGRQIKLPANPAVPPPFPVQLEPHGPLQLIRDNQLEILRPAAGNATLSGMVNHQSDQGAGAGEDLASHPVARTGATAAATSAKSKEAKESPSYVYPAPYAPWLLYPANETTSKGGLLRSPPLLGPWLINGLNGLNASLVSGGDSQTNLSDFDEDDPSLYYPPAYTFVYKSNYSNPVPPGPLVPGIVLPPPPDHFSRLEGSSTRKPPTSTTSTSSTTSSTTTTTTTTSTTRPPLPIRTSYKPKYNGITYLPPHPRQKQYVERVPVPVAVPIPIYPVNYTPRPQLVFVPSSTEEPGSGSGSRDPPLSKSNPIYYEYFEAKRQPGSIKSNVIDDFLATKPPKRHHHGQSNQIYGHHHHQREHLQHYKASPSPANDVATAAEVVNITPKPRTAQLQLHAEYEASLGQLLRSNLISPQEAGGGVAVGAHPGRFQAPDFDKQPFLPMVNYSADEQDQNAFKAIVYQPNPNPSLNPNPVQRQRHLRVGKQQLQLEPSNLEASPPQDSYLPGRHFRVGKQQHQQQQQQIYEPQVYSTPIPQFVDDPQQLRPPSPVQSNPLQFWQRPPPQFKRVRPSSKQGHPHVHPHYPPYYVPGYPSAPAGEPLYRLVPVAQHKHWRNKQTQQQQVQSQPIQVQAQHHNQNHNQGYPDRSVNIGHSLAGDILVNYNTNNQFNPQAELVPQAQLAAPPPPPPPLSYQAQSGQPLWSERERREGDRERDRDRERSVRQSREQQ